jgi:hypothetical protein
MVDEPCPSIALRMSGVRVPSGPLMNPHLWGFMFLSHIWGIDPGYRSRYAIHHGPLVTILERKFLQTVLMR